ncbi:MAG: hypothetical protein CL581_19655 [Alteromonadaceae bacterium]|nr:hypothetical protein [Alteromonadaceae bacterium]MBH83954.1 hypothetical protein [Alteromonadaceae bacterium]
MWHGVHFLSPCFRSRFKSMVRIMLLPKSDVVILKGCISGYFHKTMESDMKIHTWFGAALSGAALSISAPAAHSIILTDIVMIVDESGSMGNVQANLRTNIGQFASILSAGGVDAQYGLVGYGNSQVKPRTLTDLTDPASFATAAQGLLTSGGTEPAYTASAYALNALDDQGDLFSFRSNALKNFIIFTDEPSNGDSTFAGTIGGNAVTFASIDQLLTDSNALYNAVLSGSSTVTSIGDLATNHGGQVFDLNGLNTTDSQVVSDFVDLFATAKLQETIDFCDANPTAPGCQGAGDPDNPNEVPEPAPLALLGLGLIGLGLRRRFMA